MNRALNTQCNNYTVTTNFYYLGEEGKRYFSALCTNHPSLVAESYFVTVSSLLSKIESELVYLKLFSASISHSKCTTKLYGALGRRHRPDFHFYTVFRTLLKCMISLDTQQLGRLNVNCQLAGGLFAVALLYLAVRLL